MNISLGWLWLVMAGYEVLFGFRYQIQTACRRPRRSPGAHPSWTATSVVGATNEQV